MNSKTLNNKTLNNLFWVFNLLPFFIAIILLFILPETVPIHWTDTSQEPDGYGSKYIILLLPILFSIFSIISFFMLKIIMPIMEEDMWEHTKKIRWPNLYKSEKILVQCFPFFIFFIIFLLFCAVLHSLWSIASTSLFA
jgi:Protein of unknown function (DUF1648).